LGFDARQSPKVSRDYRWLAR